MAAPALQPIMPPQSWNFSAIWKAYGLQIAEAPCRRDALQLSLAAAQIELLAPLELDAAPVRREKGRKVNKGVD